RWAGGAGAATHRMGGARTWRGRGQPGCPRPSITRPAAARRGGRRRPRAPTGSERRRNLADREPLEVDVGGAVPAEGRERTAPGDGHAVPAAALGVIAAPVAGVDHVVDLLEVLAVGVVVEPDLEA